MHRLGQGKVQRVTTLTVDRTYDQLLQANCTRKMLAQIAGEGDIQTGPVPAELDDIADEDEREEAIRAWRTDEVNKQAEELIRRMLGQRCSRKDWTDKLDLGAKDELHCPESLQITPQKLNAVTRKIFDLATPLKKTPAKQGK